MYHYNKRFLQGSFCHTICTLFVGSGHIEGSPGAGFSVLSFHYTYTLYKISNISPLQPVFKGPKTRCILIHVNTYMHTDRNLELIRRGELGRSV